MQTRTFALVLGIIYLLVGILGFVPGILVQSAVPDGLVVDHGFGYLMGLFPVNTLHNIVHLLVGVLGLLASRTFPSARTFARGLAIFYGLLALLGLIPIPAMHMTFGLIPIFGHDIWLHALTAAVAAYFGFRAAKEATYHQPAQHA